MLESIKNFLLSIKNFFVTLISEIIQFFLNIWNFIVKIFDYCLDFFISVFEWVLGLGPRFFSLIIDSFISLLPPGAQNSVDSALSVISPHISFINSWVPLDSISTCIVIYFTFITVYICVAWVIKLIPCEG